MNSGFYAFAKFIVAAVMLAIAYLAVMNESMKTTASICAMGTSVKQSAQACVLLEKEMKEYDKFAGFGNKSEK